MAKCFGRIPITSVAVDYTGFEHIVAVAVAVVAAVAVAERAFELGGVSSVFVRPLGEVEQAVVHQVADYRRNGRIEYHLGVVDRN